MSLINVGGTQATPFYLDEDATVFNSASVTILVGNTTQPDTPISSLGAFTLAGKRKYYLASIDGSNQSIPVLKGLQNSIPSPVDIASALNASGLATEIANDMITAGIAKDTSVNNPSFGPAKSTDIGALHTSTIATDIFNTGAPPYTKSNSLDTLTNQNIASPGTLTRGPFTVSQPGWEIVIQFTATNGSAFPLNVTLSWSDSSSGQVVDLDSFGIRAGNPHQIHLYGPSRADTVKVIFDNNTSGFPATITYVLLQNSRTYLRPGFKTLSWTAVTGDTLPGNKMSQLILCQSSPTINAHTQQTRNLPAWSGNVFLAAQTGSGLADFVVQILDESSGGLTVYQAPTSATGVLNAIIGLHRSQCELIMTNNNAAAQTVEVEIIALPPE